MTHLDTQLSIHKSDLAVLRDAGSRLLDVMHMLQRENLQVLSALIGEQQTPEIGAHYPNHDVYDSETGYRYFYHSHTGPRSDREHGHFHLFSRADDTDGFSGFTHLVAISMSAQGLPLRGFTTNRWVTDEQWQPAERVSRLTKRFALQTPTALVLVHRWLQALVQLFQPQIDWLLARRDARCQAAREKRPNFFEDRRSMVLSECPFDLSRQFAWLDRLTPAPR